MDCLKIGIAPSFEDDNRNNTAGVIEEHCGWGD